MKIGKNRLKQKNIIVKLELFFMTFLSTLILSQNNKCDVYISRLNSGKFFSSKKWS